MNIHTVIPPTPPSIPSRQKKSAFSLVETVIALGVISFALTTLLGLMPVGLNMFQESVHATVRTDVVRQLTSQFQETPFDKLRESQSMLYYSDRGALVSNEEDALFGVTYSFTPNTPLLASQGGYENPNLKTAVLLFFTRADRASTPPKASMTNVLFLAPGVQ